MIVVLMGVTGVGKSAAGELLARGRKIRFVDADDFHSPASVKKLKAGQALTDEDRFPWLEALRAAIEVWIQRKESVVLACSALKAAYRKELFAPGEPIRLVYLRASPATLRERLAQREGHFAGPALLDGQLALLEEPTDAIVVDANQPIAEVVEQIGAALEKAP